MKSRWDWTYVKDLKECLTLRVPLEPRGISRDDQPRALTDFYRLQPTLFGTEIPSVQSVGVRYAALPTGGSTAVASAMRQGVSPDDRGHRYSAEAFIGPANEFANFQVPLISYIADCWKYGKEAMQSKAGMKRKRTVAETLFNRLLADYDIPWEMMLKIEDDEQARWDPETRKWDPLTPHELVVCMPTKPAELLDYAVALAAYNETGARFPFTCCCV
jgi:ribosomally synthesized peptide (two-chain TOMM family)